MPRPYAIDVPCPFCQGKRMFVSMYGPTVVCYLCRGRGKIKSRSTQFRDVQEAIAQIEVDRKTRADLDAFNAQRYR